MRRPLTETGFALIISCLLLWVVQSDVALSAESPDEAAAASPLVVTADNTACSVTAVNGGKGGIFGNDALEVVLPPESKFVFKPDGPGAVLPDGALSMKVGWQRRRRGQLQVDGRRLDGVAPPARASMQNYGDIGFQPIYLIFPTPGCWEITGRLGEESLTFVVLAEKIGEGPSWHGDW